MRKPQTSVFGHYFDLINYKYHLLLASGTNMRRKNSGNIFEILFFFDINSIFLLKKYILCTQNSKQRWFPQYRPFGIVRSDWFKQAALGIKCFLQNHHLHRWANRLETFPFYPKTKHSKNLEPLQQCLMDPNIIWSPSSHFFGIFAYFHEFFRCVCDIAIWINKIAYLS